MPDALSSMKGLLTAAGKAAGIGGVALVVLFGIYWQLIQSGLLSPLGQGQSVLVVVAAIVLVFIVTLVAMYVYLLQVVDGWVAAASCLVLILISLTFVFHIATKVLPSNETPKYIEKESAKEISFVPTVAFGRFELPDGSSDERLRTILLSLFPRSSNFKTIADPPSQHYHDIRIGGRVLEIRSLVVDNRRAIDILRKYLGPQATSQIPEKVKRIEVEVAAEAIFSAAQNALMKTSQVVRELGVDVDERPAITEMVEEAARRSAAELFATLMDTGTAARNQGEPDQDRTEAVRFEEKDANE